MVLAQKRNDSKINASWFTECLTSKTDVPEAALRDLIICSIAVKYTQVT
jgi:phosphoribosylaminoimidazolecarboxamide formyltransferase/IMP cyclohydrolase